MADMTDIYVNPALDSATGTGIAVDPYGDLQHGLDTHSRDTTNGNWWNIKAGPAEILAAELDFSTFGKPTTSSAPVGIRGYTSTAGDGGIAEIDCNSFSFIDDTSLSHFRLFGLEIHNTGTQRTVQMDNYCYVANCEFHDIQAYAALELDNYGGVYGCHFHDIQGMGVFVNYSNRVIGCYFQNGTKDFSANGTLRISFGSTARKNIISIDGSSNGIVSLGNTDISHNSILSSSGTGSGIKVTNTGAQFIIEGNVVEGFSDPGGKGINLSGNTSNDTMIYQANAVYNCTDDYVASTETPFIESDNEDTSDLGSSPFRKTGVDTYANRLRYFAPADVGNILAGTLYGADKGAITLSSGFVPYIIVT